MSLDDLLDEYQTYLLDHGHQESAAINHYYRIRKFAVWLQNRYRHRDDRCDDCNDWDPTMTRPHHIIAYRLRLKYCSQLQPSVIKKHMYSLRLFFDWFAATRHLCNPLQDVINENDWDEPDYAPPWLEPDEQLRVEGALEQAVIVATTPEARGYALRIRAAILLLLYTGISDQDLIRLSLDDLIIHDERDDVLRVRSNHKTWEIPLPTSVSLALCSYLDARSHVPYRRLFHDQYGVLKSVPQLLRRIARRSGIPASRLTVSTLRYTYVYNQLKAGMSLDQILVQTGLKFRSR